MMFKYNGFSIMGEYAKKQVVDAPLAEMDFNFRESLVDVNGRSYLSGSGINTQVSYLFKNNLELATRYTRVTPDTDPNISFKGTKEYTFGLSKYVVGHNLKVQADVSLVDQDGTDINKLRYRLQTEFAF